MKTFIFLVYLIVIFVFPQILQKLANKPSKKDDEVIVMVGGSIILGIVILLFTFSLINWEILIFNFKM